jgi:hypothetical protein
MNSLNIWKIVPQFVEIKLQEKIVIKDGGKYTLSEYR